MFGAPNRGRALAAALLTAAALLCSGCLRVEVGAGGQVGVRPEGSACGYLQGPECRVYAPFTKVTLEAQPASGWRFAGFFDANRYELCAGETRCRIPLYWARAVQAVFTPTFFPESDPVLGRDGVVSVLDAGRGAIHRYDLAQARWLPSLPIGSVATSLAAATDRDALYVAYYDGAVRRIDLARDEGEQLVARLAIGSPRLYSVDGGVFAQSYASVFLRHDGTTQTLDGGFDVSDTLAWSPRNARLFGFDRARGHWLSAMPWSAAGGFTAPRAVRAYPAQQEWADRLAISPDGRRLLVGGMQIAAADTLEPIGRLPAVAAEAAWLSGGAIAVLRAEGADTRFERRGPAQELWESALVPGWPVAVFDRGDEAVVATRTNAELVFTRRALSEDVDADGVRNADDAFPRDPAASRDADADGAPDAWNPGRGAADSTTGLAALDAFPTEWACRLPEHGRSDAPGTCDFAAGMPALATDPANVVMDRDGGIYLLAPEHRRIFRWSWASGRFERPLAVGAGAIALTYSASSHRLYLAYEDGSIRKLDIGRAVTDSAFARVDSAPRALVAANAMLLAAVENGARSFDADGRELSSFSYSLRRSERVMPLLWAPARRRAYFATSSPSGDLAAFQVDSVRGAISYFGPLGSLALDATPVAISPSGDRVLTRSGQLFDARTLRGAERVPASFDAAAWLDESTLVTMRADDSERSRIERWTASRELAGFVRVRGAPLALFVRNGRVLVVTLRDGRPTFFPYTPSDDDDADGVANESDAFPDDPAASLDRDGDGAPDAWNVGRGPADSTSGLDALDAFPDQAGCQRAEQAAAGDPTRCDFERATPAYAPPASEIAADAAGVVYLLDAAHARVRRWSVAERAHLDPIAIGTGATQLAYAASEHALYVGYASRVITRIELAGDRRELRFASEERDLLDLLSLGSFVAVATSDALRIRRLDGTLADDTDADRPRALAWDAGTRRLLWLPQEPYESRPRSARVAASSGAITVDADGFDSRQLAKPPLRLATGGARFFTGSSLLFDVALREATDALPFEMTDLAWRDAGSPVTLRSHATGQSLVETWSERPWRTARRAAFEGEPLRVLETAGSLVAVTQQDDAARLHVVALDDDADDDGVVDEQDAFPVDPAASLDADGDRHADAWNPGRGPADSTTGLRTLDAFPTSSACQSASQAVPGQPGQCDVAATIPYESAWPTNLALDRDGVVLWFDALRSRVHRWSFATHGFIDPVPIDGDALAMAYDPERHELIVSYRSGRLERVALVAPYRATPFAVVPGGSSVITAAGSFVFVDGYAEAITLRRDGSIAGRRPHDLYGYSYPNEFAWDAARHVLFWGSRSDWNSLRRETIDPLTGAFGTPTSGLRIGYAPGFSFRLAPDGARLFRGTGEILDATTLDLLETRDVTATDAAWTLDGGLVTVRGRERGALAEQWSADGRVVKTASLSGIPLRTFVYADEAVVVTGGDRATHFQVFSVAEDRDADGAANALDGFPDDPAASLDRDGDGAPDDWNPGRGPADSTSGLTALDAFPDDAACQRAEQALAGDPSRCDVAGSLPAHTAATDHVLIDRDGVVHLLVPGARRIFRWSSSERAHLNPIPIAAGATHLTYQSATHRLYVAYTTGAITSVSLPDGRGEVPFARTRDPVSVLAATGAFLFAATETDDRIVFDQDGGRAALRQRSSSTYAGDWVDAEWHESLGRLFLLSRANAITSVRIDRTTGLFGAWTTHSTPPQSLWAPLRLSRPGGRIASGSGRVFDSTAFTELAVLAPSLRDLAWDASGSVNAIESSTERGVEYTKLRRWRSARTEAEATPVLYPGTPIRLLDAGATQVVVTLRDGRPAFIPWIADGDADGDGVPDAADALPADPAASLDSDGDGAPDVWNDGRGPADSTSGLTALDAFPLDFACRSPEDGLASDPSRCDAERVLPPYAAARAGIAIDRDGVVYLLAQSERRIHRWSSARRTYLNPIPLVREATRIAYSAADHRLYLLDTAGRIDRIDLAEGTAAVPFVTQARFPREMVVAGSVLVVVDAFRVISTYQPDGSRSDERPLASDLVYATVIAWSESDDRLYAYGGIETDRGLASHSIDPATGAIGEAEMVRLDPIPRSDTAPLRVSRDAARALTGTREIVETASGARVAMLPASVTDAQWLAGNELLTLRSTNPFLATQSRLERWSASGILISALDYEGAPVAVLESGTGFVVVTNVAGRLRFELLAAGDDVDGDGVADPEDGFVRDPAAALDTDRDGVPDAWNPGRGPADSTSGLTVLDAFPQEAACQRAEDARVDAPAICDVTRAIGAFDPTQVLRGDDGVVYMLDPARRRVFRWSLAARADLNPLVIGAGARQIAHDAERGRLYVVYDTGLITRIEPATGATERRFIQHEAAFRDQSITVVEGRLIVSSAFSSIEAFDAGGTFLGGSRSDWFMAGKAFSWDPSERRLFAARAFGATSSSLGFWSFDPATGAFGPWTPLAVERVGPVIAPRISQARDRVIGGSGEVFALPGGVRLGQIATTITDAAWLPGGELAALRVGATDAMSVLDRLDPQLTVSASFSIPGGPLAVFVNEGGLVVATRRDGRPVFTELALDGGDGDADGIDDAHDAFPGDPAAALDADGDGAPDAWNPGRSEADSTTGLAALDAFPEDTACQRGPHGVDGVCDARLVVPREADAPWCSVDDVSTLPTTGSVAGGWAIVPLCSGWILSAEGERLWLRQVGDGRSSVLRTLEGEIAALALDETGPRVYAAVGASVHRIDLVASEDQRIETDEAVDRLIVGSDGAVWGVERSSVDRSLGLFRIARDATTARHFEGVSAAALAPAPDGDVFVLQQNQSPPLARKRFELASGELETVDVSDLTAVLGPGSLATSRDLTRVALIGSEPLLTRIGGREVRFLDAGDLSERGAPMQRAYLSIVALDATGARVAVTDATSLDVFEIATGARLSAASVGWCSPSAPVTPTGVEVAFSRGGRVAYRGGVCARTPDGDHRTQWLRVD